MRGVVCGIRMRVHVIAGGKQQRVVVGVASWGTGVVKCGLGFVLVMLSLIWDVRIGSVSGAMLQAWVRRVRVPHSTVLSSLWVAVRVEC